MRARSIDDVDFDQIKTRQDIADSLMRGVWDEVREDIQRIADMVLDSKSYAEIEEEGTVKGYIVQTWLKNALAVIK